MYWFPDELVELEKSAVLGKIGKEDADVLFSKNILPVVRSMPGEFGLAGDDLDEQTLKCAHRMASTLMAYAFDLEPEEKEFDDDGYATEEEDEDLEKGMVPLADMLNANGDRNTYVYASCPRVHVSDVDRDQARLFYEKGSLVMKSLIPIPNGEEIFNDYGPLPRSDLLRRYGYITPNYTQYDVVEVSRDLVIDIAKADLGLGDQSIQEGLSFLEDNDAIEDGYDITRVKSNERTLDIFQFELKMLGLVLALAALEPDLNSQNNKSRLHKSIEKDEFPPAWFHLMRAVVRRRQQEYGKPLDEDRVLLRDLKEKFAGGMFLGDYERKMKRRIMAVEVRVGEKEILANTLMVLEQADSSVAAVDASAGNKRSGDNELEDNTARKRR